MIKQDNNINIRNFLTSVTVFYYGNFEPEVRITPAPLRIASAASLKVLLGKMNIF